jgi:2-polyprenyl-6-methoxyphenol hydroxylase-like FAD-dependent oxidoreductase
MDAEVIVVGAGPVGLMAAMELALAGIDVAVVEALDERGGQSKAMSLQPRTAEVLDLRGLLARAGQHEIAQMNGGHFGTIPLSYEGLGTRYPFQVGLLQRHLETVLETRVCELGGKLWRGWALTDLEQDATGVTVRGPSSLRASFVVAADGAHSTVRKLQGDSFSGTDATRYTTIADVILGPGVAEPPTRWTSMGQTRRVKPDGSFASVVWIGEDGLFRFVYFDGQTQRAEVTGEEVAAAFERFYGDEYLLGDVRYASRFSNATRQAENYRYGRVFLAGDAAHIHPPAGGQGLNLGVQDAFNLGWKLAAVVRGTAPETLLDSYHAERYPVGARVLNNTLAQGVLGIRDPQHLALRQIFTELMGLPQANQQIAGMISGLDVDYGGPGYEGIRMPDFETDGGWASALFHTGNGVLLTTGKSDAATTSPLADRIVHAEVPVLPWPELDAVLVRPDGYVCWTSASPQPLAAALSAWFGSA